MSITRLTTNGLSGTKYDTVSADNYYMEPIATTLVGAGGAATIEFTNIPQGYKHLQIRANARAAYSGSFYDYPRFQFNGDTGTNYARHLLYGDGSGAAGVKSGASTSDTKLAIGEIPAAGGLANTFGPFVVDILDYANVYKFKTARTLSGNEQNYSSSNRGIIHFYSGLWMNTAAVTSIKFYCDNGNFAQYSQLSLYGVKA